MKDIRIRQMNPADIPEVETLEQSIFSVPWSGKGFADALAGEQNLFYVAQREDGQICGYCGLYVSWEEAEITNVAVEETCRLRGIGDALLGGMLAAARLRGVRTVFLEVRPSNTAAIGLYQKYGFVSCGTRKDFYHCPAEDALCMKLSL